jgi:hypothetical protein
MQPTGGGSSTQSASRMWRSSDGKMRIDTPTTSVISDPTSQQTILLDHTNKEASIIPMKPSMLGGAPPTMPQAPVGAGQAQPMQVQDLGKSMIEGHEVEGKRFTLPPPPSLPTPSAPLAPQAKMPGMPQVNMPGMKVPGAPPIPGMPPPPSAAASGAPQPPKPPQGPAVAEVWTSVKLKVPVLTKVTLPTGEQTTYCKPTSTAEPHPSLFQIPPGYKIKPKP